MTETIARSDMSHILEDVGDPRGGEVIPGSVKIEPGIVEAPCSGCGKPKDPAVYCNEPGCKAARDRHGPRATEPIPGIEPFEINPPKGVTLAPASTGQPAEEIQATIPVVVIRFKRGRCIIENPIDTIVALEDAPSKLNTGSASELAGLLRQALTSTTKIEFDRVEGAENQPDQLTFTETRAINDALFKWSETLGKS